jgi:hypothetical protein
VATQQTQLPLLRIYWYDAMRLGRPTPEQMALADFPDIKIRLGQVNSAGEQKGVDACNGYGGIGTQPGDGRRRADVG